MHGDQQASNTFSVKIDFLLALLNLVVKYYFRLVCKSSWLYAKSVFAASF